MFFLLNALKIIFLLGFLVLIHESGHFFVAKLCRVKVNQFAIGFGPTIWKKQGKETLYALRLVPLGGFVSMEGEEERSENEGSFSKTSIPKRIAIVVAGGLVNIFFGLIVYFSLGAITGNYISNTIKSIEYDSVEQAGIQTGDKILEIDGKKIRLNSDISKVLKKSEGKSLNVLVERNGVENIVEVIPNKKISKYIGIYFGKQSDAITAKVEMIYPGSPAEVAGLKAKDIIISVDGKSVDNNPYLATQYLNETNKENVEIVVDRKGEEQKITIKPVDTITYFLGVKFAVAENTFINNITYGFWDTIEFSTSIIENLKQLFTGKVGAEQLTGPIGISEMVAKTNGIKEFIYLLALISLSLGVTNLLPFPPLDGGKVVIYIIEAIRRKPMKENIEIGIQTAGFVIMIALSIYVAYNDVLRIF